MNQVSLTHSDLQSFINPRKRFSEVVLKPLGITVASIVVAVTVFYAANAASFLRVAKSSEQVAAPSTTALIVENSTTPEFTDQNQVIETQAPQGPSIPNNTLSYGAQSIDAPIHWDSSLDPKDYFKLLEGGIIHIDGTPKPGNQGMAIFFGHSSYYAWAKGDYNTIFARLHNTTAGETFTINYNNVEYTYRVTKTYVVQPHQLEILNSDPSLRGARLITCTPIGTDKNRLVVEAEQISPSPAQNTAFTQKQFSGKLLGDR